MNLRSHLERTDTNLIGNRPTRIGMFLGPLVLFVASIGVPGSVASGSPVAASTTTSVQAFMTLYGYVDNSPSGTDIAHPCIHSQAGGTGTFADPITFATDVNELPWCEVIYVPYMERYFIHEDECSQCDTNWTDLHLYRFDMWAGGNSASLSQPERSALLRCESYWSRADSITDPNNPTIVVNPPPNLPVATDPIFSPPTTCWQPITLTNPGRQTTDLPASSVSLPISAVDTSPDETLEYHAVGLPVGLSIVAASGVISGTPTMGQRTSVTVTASDAYNLVSIKFRWIVKAARKARTGAAAGGKTSQELRARTPHSASAR